MAKKKQLVIQRKEMVRSTRFKFELDGQPVTHPITIYFSGLKGSNARATIHAEEDIEIDDVRITTSQ